LCITLLSGFSIPLHCLGEILRNAPALLVNISERDLSGDISLLSKIEERRGKEELLFHSSLLFVENGGNGQPPFHPSPAKKKTGDKKQEKP
jgi:hypothetical protein